MQFYANNLLWWYAGVLCKLCLLVPNKFHYEIGSMTGILDGIIYHYRRNPYYDTILDSKRNAYSFYLIENNNNLLFT